MGGVVLLFLTALGVRLGGLSLTHGLKAFDDFSCVVVFCGTFYHVLSFLPGLFKNWPQIAILLFQKSIISMFHALGLRDACEGCCLRGTLTFCQEPVFLINLYWSRVALQCCISSCCTASGSGIYVYIYPLSFGVPSHLGQSRVPVVYSWCSLVI